MLLANEQRDAWIQDVLDKAFSESDLAPDDVESIRMEAKMMLFPRDLPYCRCRRCISPYEERSVTHYTVSLDTAKGTFVGWIPGPKDAFAHPKEGTYQLAQTHA